jgi:hypothetical protein
MTRVSICYGFVIKFYFQICLKGLALASAARKLILTIVNIYLNEKVRLIKTNTNPVRDEKNTKNKRRAHSAKPGQGECGPQ